MNKSIQKLYSFEQKRKYGIFSTGLNRFLLVDHLDVWIVLETANLISSKIPNVVYMLPYESNNIDNDNCLDFGISDKTGQKLGATPLLFATQTPVLRTLMGENVVVKNENSVESQKVVELKQFVNYVHLHSYALNYTEAFTKYDETNSFAQKYLSKETLAHFKTTVENTGLDESIYFYIRQILYLADSIEDAESKLHRLWLEHSRDIPKVREIYFRLLEKEQPEDLLSLERSKSFTAFSG